MVGIVSVVSIKIMRGVEGIVAPQEDKGLQTAPVQSAVALSGAAVRVVQRGAQCGHCSGWAQQSYEELDQWMLLLAPDDAQSAVPRTCSFTAGGSVECQQQVLRTAARTLLTAAGCRR